MKKICLCLLLSMNSIAFAKSETKTLFGEDARAVMEALASSPEVKLDGELDPFGKMSIHVQHLVCHFEHVTFPDEWMSRAICEMGSEKTVLKNPLALIRAIMKTAQNEGAAGTIYVDAGKVDCSLDYKSIYAKGNKRDSKAYSCKFSLE